MFKHRNKQTWIFVGTKKKKILNWFDTDQNMFHCSPVLFQLRSQKKHWILGNLHLLRKLSRSHLWLQSQLKRKKKKKGQRQNDKVFSIWTCTIRFSYPYSPFIPIVSFTKVNCHKGAATCLMSVCVQPKTQLWQVFVRVSSQNLSLHLKKTMLAKQK